jgi:hypothetical protein
MLDAKRDAEPSREGGRFLSNGSRVVTALENKEGVVAAIMAAVTAYLEEEEGARLALAAEPRPRAAISLWRVFGRREAMRPRGSWRRRMA